MLVVGLNAPIPLPTSEPETQKVVLMVPRCQQRHKESKACQASSREWKDESLMESLIYSKDWFTLSPTGLKLLRAFVQHCAALFRASSFELHRKASGRVLKSHSVKYYFPFVVEQLVGLVAEVPRIRISTGKAKVIGQTYCCAFVEQKCLGIATLPAR
eukprot:6465154-Amphidinium_carterae.1